MSVAAILGSAFRTATLLGRPLQPRTLRTPFGPATLYRHPQRDDAWLLFRHGIPHRWLPHQIPWRAHAWALHQVGCQALLITSSVGVLDASLPLNRPMLLADLLWPDNRLPDGSACTIFPEPVQGQGHLVLDEGIFSPALTRQLAELLPSEPPMPHVVFAYVCGPRTKTAAENRWWAAQGAQVNSMSVGPESVLANELGIPVAGLVIGHKYSLPDAARTHERALGHSLDAAGIDASLDDARTAVERAVDAFLTRAQAVTFGNHLHRL
ncbi:MAG: MTAP family purine nucleoside phosphorylase [Oligoflexia bacterium]|nr:MTAP family purine nucleoside phosphorylase [Oligoflexia bacterium]